MSPSGHWREAIASWPIGVAFSPRPAMHLLSLKIMLGVIFGSDQDDLGRARLRVSSRGRFTRISAHGVCGPDSAASIPGFES